MKIGEKTFASLSYTLKVAGEIVDSTTADSPMEFVFGAGYLLPAFESNIKGLSKGDKFKFTLEAKDGYGEIVSEAIVELPTSTFMIDGAIEEGLLDVGNQIPMSTSDGQHLLGVVKEVIGENVKIDFNHPMAGNVLNFNGEIIGVREATDEDLMNGLAAQGGCGCGCDSCDDDGCASHEEGESCGCN